MLLVLRHAAIAIDKLLGLARRGVMNFFLMLHKNKPTAKFIVLGFPWTSSVSIEKAYVPRDYARATKPRFYGDKLNCKVIMKKASGCF